METKVDKFNIERLLRSVGFTSEFHTTDDKGLPIVKKNDGGTSRFYDHKKGYRVELIYDDNKSRQSENLMYYLFVDFRPLELRLGDADKNKLAELNNEIDILFNDLLNSDLKKYICMKPSVWVSPYRQPSKIDKGDYTNEVDYWMAMFKSLGWDFD
jgi:hypothetical protein